MSSIRWLTAPHRLRGRPLSRADAASASRALRAERTRAPSTDAGDDRRRGARCRGVPRHRERQRLGGRLVRGQPHHDRRRESARDRPDRWDARRGRHRPRRGGSRGACRRGYARDVHPARRRPRRVALPPRHRLPRIAGLEGAVPAGRARHPGRARLHFTARLRGRDACLRGKAGSAPE